jgi:hypothetical protein
MAEARAPDPTHPTGSPRSNGSSLKRDYRSPKALDVVHGRETTHDLTPQKVGGRSCTLPGASPRHQEAAPLSALGQLLRETRLADPRLARQKHEATAPGEGVLEALVEDRELGVASNEDRHPPGTECTAWLRPARPSSRPCRRPSSPRGP